MSNQSVPGICSNDLSINFEFFICYQNTILLLIPCLFFWILLPLLIFQTKRVKQFRQFLPLPLKFLLITKYFTLAILVVDAIFIFTRYFNDGDLGIPTSIINAIFPVILAFTVLGLLYAQYLCQQVGLIGSGIIFNSWLLFTLCGIPELITWIQKLSDPNEPTSNGRSVGFIIWWTGCFIQTILLCFADQRQAKDSSDAEHRSSFVNHLFLHWFSQLPAIGAKKDLKVDDLFPLNERHKAEFLENLWNHYWIPTMEKYEQDRKHAIILKVKNEIQKGMKNNLSQQENETKISPPSVMYNLFKMFKYEFISATGIKLIADFLHYINPFLLSQLITNVMDPNGSIWTGLFYGLMMFLISEIRSLMLCHSLVTIFRIGIKLQSAMTAAVYRKTLKLSNLARKDRSVGEIVNLMAIDIERIAMLVDMCQNFWSAPCQITLAMIYLFTTLGIAALPGVVITCLFVPYTIFTSKWLRDWMIQQMKLKDERTKICNEILNGIKVIKFYAWEIPMLQIVEKIRKKELQTLFKSSIVSMSVDIFNWSIPFLVALCSFATFIFVNPENALTPQIAFVSLTLFNQLRFPMTIIGMLINLSVDAIVSNKRLKEFFVAEELEENGVIREALIPETTESVGCEQADFSWDVSHDSPEASTAIPNLKDITMQVPRGSLVAIVGRVGSGKSSLLSAMLGEMEKLRGTVAVRGNIAYVPQQAWIQNLSLRDNILFGQPFNQKFYDKVIEACALTPDLLILPNGDRTEIGEKGINLSGGQKARISLARAIYQNCDIYFLDDPLSAVDSQVGKHIFNKVIGPNGLLRNKTRIWSTNNVTFLKQVDQILITETGKIVEQGPFSQLLSCNNSLLGLIMGAMKMEFSKEEKTGKQSENLKNKEDESEQIQPKDFVDVTDLPTAEFIRQFSTASVLARSIGKESTISKPSITEKTRPEALMTAETVNIGRVKPGVYLQYFRSGNYFLMGAFFFFYLIYQSLIMFRNFWLSNWADDYELLLSNQTIMNSHIRLEIFGIIGGFEMIMIFLAMISFVFGTLRASKYLHEPVLLNILKSPMSFFDTTPLGRILNRLSKDIEVIDLKFPTVLKTFIHYISQVVFVLVINTFTNPVFLIVMIPLTLIYIYALKYHIPTSRQLRRLESNSRSPIYSFFSETIQGVHVIRAYDKTNDFFKVMADRINNFIQIQYMITLSQRWLAVRLDVVGNFVVLFAAVFSVLANYWGWISSPGLVGLSVSYALTITEVLNMAVRQISLLETSIVSVERLKEYVELKTEASWKIEGKEPPKEWPNQGKIQFVNYSTRYRPGLDLVVKNINANILPGEKIGIVGRTGAGKSSLTLALFRMVEAVEGQICIDGVVVAEIGLHDLRSNVTIIPQDPVLFSGSMRFNLDPFGKYTDDAIWNALELAHLKNFVSSLPDGLEHKITEGGENISVGQRQLVCLARALLRRSKVLVLDEATAAIDLETDALIQETIRNEFKGSTILTIAHRLDTILDYNKIMVLDKGEIKEFDSPSNLLAKHDSLFYSMVEDTKSHQKS